MGYTVEQHAGLETGRHAWKPPAASDVHNPKHSCRPGSVQLATAAQRRQGMSATEYTTQCTARDLLLHTQTPTMPQAAMALQNCRRRACCRPRMLSNAYNENNTNITCHLHQPRQHHYAAAVDVHGWRSFPWSAFATAKKLTLLPGLNSGSCSSIAE